MIAPAGPYFVIHRHLPEHGGATGWEKRWAYATLEEARLKARTIIVDAALAANTTVGYSALHDFALAFPAAGATLTLPDGSEIVVEATEWRELVDAVTAVEGIPERGSAGARWPTPEQKIAILAAWNAEYGIPVQEEIS